MISAAHDPDLKLTPYWWEAAPLTETVAADIPGRTDVGIVGAGYAGLSAALTLARAGRSVVVFDSQHAGNLQHSLAIGAVDDHQEFAAGRYR